MGKINISNRYKYLYFVVPKCASATVRQSLKEFTDIGYPVTDFIQHQTILNFLASEQGIFFDKDYLKFTFVRNPYDRIYSGYLQDRFASTQFAPWRLVKEPIFNLIGNDFNRYIIEYVRYAKIFDDWDWICFCPMHAFAFINGVCVLDYIGRAESIVDSLRELSVLLGIYITKADDVNVNFPPSSKLKYLKYYNRSTVEVVNEIYAEDFRLFGYEMLDPNDFPVKSICK